MDIARYQPPLVKQTSQMQTIAQIEDELLKELFNACFRVLDNAFVDTLDEEGINRWEAMLSIRPQEGEDLEERRFRIKMFINGDAPFTMKSLENKLSTVCGEDEFLVEYDNQAYCLNIYLTPTASTKEKSILEFLDRALPCNISLNIGSIFNTHQLLADLTHEELSSYTHIRLRQGVVG